MIKFLLPPTFINSFPSKTKKPTRRTLSSISNFLLLDTRLSATEKVFQKLSVQYIYSNTHGAKVRARELQKMKYLLHSGSL